MTAIKSDSRFPAWFQRNWPPNAPTPPRKPDPERVEYIRKEGAPDITLYDENIYELSGVFRCNRDYHDESVSLYECNKKTTPNPRFAKEQQMYERNLASYRKKVEAHKAQLKQWVALCRKFDADESAKTIANKKALFLKLKEELGE